MNQEQANDLTPWAGAIKVTVSEHVFAAAQQNLYELARQDGFQGSLSDFIASLKGERGQDGQRGEQGLQGLPGQDGERGERGEQGQRGEPGAKGEPGERGQDGAAATVSIGTVTSGDTASVTNSGTATAAVFDFVLPRGERGERGADGTGGGAGGEAVKEFKVYVNGNAMEDLKEPGNYLIYNPTVLRAIEAPGQAGGILTVNSTPDKGIIIWEWTCPFYGITAFRIFQNRNWRPWDFVNYRNIAAAKEIPRTMIVTTGDSTAGDLYQGNTMQGAIAQAQGLNVYAPQQGYQAFTTAMSGQLAEYTLMINGGLTPKFTFPGGQIPEHGQQVAVQVEIEGAKQPNIVNGKAYFLPNGRKGIVTGMPNAPMWRSNDNVREQTAVFTDQGYAGRIESWSGYENCIQIVAIGKNDINLNGKAEQVIPVIEKITDCFRRERFIVCTLWSDYLYSPAQIAEMNKLNDWIRKKYGRYCYDLEAFVLSDAAFAEMGVQKSEEDIAAVAKGVIAKSVTKDNGKHMAPAVAWKAVRNIVDLIKTMGMV